MNDPLNLVGTAVGGRYDVATCVGVYGARVVYQARHRDFGLDTRLEVVAAAEQPCRAFVRAGGKVASLGTRFSAIPQVRDGGLQETPSGLIAYVASEWVEGPTLADAIASSGKARFDTELVLDWMKPVLEAVVAAHREGLVHAHLDLNAFFVEGVLGPRASLKIDGLVEAAWRPQLQGGALPMRTPTAGFAAPELASGDATLVGPWSDVYGLAAVLSVLMCGSSSRAMRERGLPAGVQYAFDKALSQRIDARFKTLASFRASMMDGLVELTGGSSRNPRRTMVVADPESKQAEGSAGGFEVTDDEEPQTHEPQRGKARVRLAYTQPAMNVPEAIARLEAAAGPASGPQPQLQSGSYPRTPSGPHPVVKPTKSSSGNFVVLLVTLLVIAVGGGVAVGVLVFR